MSQDLLREFPVPSREFILASLAKLAKPASSEELAQQLDIRYGYQLEGLRRRLLAMERDGQLIFTSRQCYALPERLDLLRGTVIGHRDGFGFLRVNGRKEDYYLSCEQMKIAIHGDIVMAELQAANRKGRNEARIVRIVVPQSSKIVGRFLVEAGYAFVVPDDSRMSFDIMIPPEATNGARIGFMVVVELTKRPTSSSKAIGRVVEVLGDQCGPKMAIQIALRTHQISYIWPPDVETQLTRMTDTEEVPEEAKRGRVDLRSLPLVTIDSEDARDFDDAVYCEKKRGGGWRLWVAIADVSYYVRPHTPLDQEARNRTTSIYFPLQVIPMLPEVLSNGLCSLNPQVDRLCLVCEMTISAHGLLSSYKFYEAVMNSYARLTYNKVWQLLQQRHKEREYVQLMKQLTNLYEMSNTLQQARKQRGSLSFETEEAKFIFNADRIERIEPVTRNDAHKIIEECMIQANIAAARFLEKHQEPALYRVHDRPSIDQITAMRTVLGELGITLGGRDQPAPKDYVNMIEQVVRQDHDLMQMMLLRSMKPASYDLENRGHFGLALPAYAHFTSPIRRYPDLLLHRGIKYRLCQRHNSKVKTIKGRATSTGGWHSELEEIRQLGQQCSISERRAEEATRDVTDWLKCDFMQNHVGKVFRGMIASVTSFGFFVRISELLIDGLVHISSLNNDYYRYDNVGQRLIGESRGLVYRLGDAVDIRVKTVDMEERKIYFLLISRYSRRDTKKCYIPYGQRQRRRNRTSTKIDKQ